MTNNFEDTYTPIWPSPTPGWSQVPLISDLRFRFNLFDEDLVNDDPIGVAEVNYADVVAALKDGHIFQVELAAQTNNQLLFVAMSVMPQ